jgi:hypothetical protein
MNIRKQLLHILSFLPMLAAPASFECSVDELGQVSPGSVCCRMSKDYGLTSCESGPKPRDVLLTFRVPQIQTHIQTLDGVMERIPFDGRYGILYPDKNDKDNENRTLLHVLIFGAMLSLITYYPILSSKQCQLVKNLTAALLLSTVIISPCLYVSFFRIQNTSVRCSFILSAFLYILRIVEAFFGSTPKGALQSAKAFCIYFILPAEIVYDEKTTNPAKASKKDALHSIWVLMHTYVFNTLFFSFLCHMDYLPFGPTRAGRYDERATLQDYFDPRHLGNCYLLALWFQQTLAWGSSIIQFMVQALTGWKCTPMIDSPLYSTTKPSEFWSKRWNAVVHSLLKRGVYTPVRKYFSVMASSILVFAVSGLLHEWLIFAAYKYNPTVIDAYYSQSNIITGTNFLFFLYGIVPVTLEKLLDRLGLMKWLWASLPRPTKTFLTLMTSLPLAFWFIDPYMHGRLFLDHEGLGFTIFKIESL